MYKLYYSAGSCSRAIHVALLEVGAKFELEPVDFANRSAEFMRLNPRGQVPVLVADGKALKEGAAILTWVLDKYKSPLMPQGDGWDRAQALQWLAWANATLHPAYGRVFGIRHLEISDDAKKSVAEMYSKQIYNLWKEAEERLATSKYLAGDQLTAADILVTVISAWQPDALTAPVQFGPNVTRLINEVKNRASYQQAVTTETEAASKAA